MMRKKRVSALLALVLALALVLPLAGCSSQEPDSTTTANETTAAGESSRQTAESATEPTETTPGSTTAIGTAPADNGTQETSAVTETQPKASEQPARALNPKASLKVWFTTSIEENKALQKIADAFTKETGVKVEVLDSNFFTIRQKFPVAAKTSQKPDIIYMQSADLGALVESDYLRPVEWLDDELRSKFHPIAFDGLKYGGKYYGVGYSASAYGIVYNKKLVTTLPKDWNEFFEMGGQLTKKDSSGEITTHGILLCPSSYWFMYPIIKNYGGYYFGLKKDGSYNPDDLGIATEGTAKALNKLLELKSKGLTTQSYTEIDSNISQKFSEGKVAMFIYELWDAKKYKDAGIDYGYAPLPANDDGSGAKPLTTIQGFVLNKYSKWPDEADAFLKYYMKDENQQLLYEAGNGGIQKTGARNTCSRAVASSSYVKSSEVLQALINVSLSGEIFPANPEAPVIWNYAKTAMDSIFFKNAPVESKLKELSDKIKSDIAKMRK